MEIRHRRPFAKPWKLEGQDESFQIRDAAGRILAYVYFEDEPTRRKDADWYETARGLVGGDDFVETLPWARSTAARGSSRCA